MNRREEDRINLQLPCRVSFPGIWPGSVDGFTTDLHRTGVLVACRLKPGCELPSIGDTANVHIALPLSPFVPQKFMNCSTTLIRVEKLGDSSVQFALQIRDVNFDEISHVSVQLMEMDSDSCRYVM